MGIKIKNLPANDNPSGDEVFAATDGSTTKKISVKQVQKVSGATQEDNFLSADENGRPKDSGKKAGDFAEAVHSHSKDQVGLSNVDNTSDADKPVSTLQQTALDTKVDKVAGKELSENDYSDAEKAKVAANEASKHDHANKPVLDKFGENGAGKPTYNGNAVDTTIAQRDVYDGLDSNDNTISLAASQGKVLNDSIVAHEGATNPHSITKDTVDLGITDTVRFGKLGVGKAPVSIAHIYENTAATGEDAGLTIEQAGAGDATLQFLLTETRRWTMGVDNSDDDKFKITPGLDVGSSPALVMSVAKKVSFPGSIELAENKKLLYLNPTSHDDDWSGAFALQFGTYLQIGHGASENTGYMAANARLDYSRGSTGGSHGSQNRFTPVYNAGGASYVHYHYTGDINFYNLATWGGSSDNKQFPQDMKLTMTISKDSRVGIGTSTPKGKFVVYDGGYGFQKASMGGVYSGGMGWATAYFGMNAVRENADNWHFGTETLANGGAVMYANREGKLRFVTIETTGGAAKTLTDAEVSSRTKMIIDHIGNVGIGTTSPSEKLDVDGNIKLATSHWIGPNSSHRFYFFDSSGTKFTDHYGKYLRLRDPSSMLEMSGGGINLYNGGFLTSIAAGIGETGVSQTGDITFRGRYNDGAQHDHNVDIKMTMIDNAPTSKLALVFQGTEQFVVKSNGIISMLNIPTSDAGLSAGDVWRSSNSLKIV